MARTLVAVQLRIILLLVLVIHQAIHTANSISAQRSLVTIERDNHQNSEYLLVKAGERKPVVFKFTYPDDDNSYLLNFRNGTLIIGCDTGITHMLAKCTAEDDRITEYHTLIIHATPAESVNGTNVTCQVHLPGEALPQPCGNFTNFMVLVHNEDTQTAQRESSSKTPAASTTSDSRAPGAKKESYGSMLTTIFITLMVFLHFCWPT